MNLFNTKTPIEPINPQVFDYIKQQQYNQELTPAYNKSYIPITTCLFEAIVSDYSSQLLPRDIIFLLQIFNLYSAALNKKQKTIIYSSEKLAKLLGYKAKDKNNMRSIVLRKVKKLEQLGLLNVTRHKDKKGSDKVNEIVPILPDPLYDKIKYAPFNFNVDSTRLKGESNIQHILRTKLFTPIDLEFIKSLFNDDSMPATHKLFYLNCIVTSYKNNQTTGKLSFATTSQELISKNNISQRTLFNIFDFIKNQYPDYFIEVNHNYSKSDDIDSNRYDKSIFVISLNPIVIPKSFLNKNNLAVQKEIDQTKKVEEKVEYGSIDNTALVADNETAKPDTYQLSKTRVQIWKPSSANLEAHNNKDIIIKESNKNIDANIDKNLDKKNAALDKREKNNQIKPQTFLKTSNSQHLESEQGSLSSKSLKNSVKAFIDALPSLSNSNAENASSTIQDISDKSNKTNIPNKCNTVIPKQTASYSTNVVIHKKKAYQAKAINDRKQKDFRYFYPLAEKDISLLNSRANREFSNNFVNQLLLKLYIKYPEKRFKNRFIFLSYMVHILANEKHQGPLVNHTSFRFGCSIGTREKDLLDYEKYLSKIEDSLDTSKDMCVKKKIAGRYSSEVAYKILTKAQFKTNHDNSFITVLVPNNLDLSERQTEILSQQLETVYGINGYYVQELEGDAIQPLKSKATAIDSNEKSTENLASSNTSSAISEEVLENTVWHQIRKSLREELGEVIDTVWFSKAVVAECKDTKTLTLIMLTRFMADFLKNNYSHVIRRPAGSVGVKMVEYEYEQNNRV